MTRRLLTHAAALFEVFLHPKPTGTYLACHLIGAPPYDSTITTTAAAAAAAAAKATANSYYTQQFAHHGMLFFFSGAFLSFFATCNRCTTSNPLCVPLKKPQQQ
ncbi:MAG: hypothetical protein AAFR36_31945 [Bacteroidota bacterium]